MQDTTAAERTIGRCRCVTHSRREPRMTATLDSILADILRCKVCEAYLPRPLPQAGPSAPLVIIGGTGLEGA